MNRPDVIDCVDCGGRAHLLNDVPEDDLEPGDVLTYRCADCNDRWDLVYEPEDRDG